VRQLNTGRRYTKRSYLVTSLVECGACGVDRIDIQRKL
jgi:hypothetical protein